VSKRRSESDTDPGDNNSANSYIKNQGLVGWLVRRGGLRHSLPDKIGSVSVRVSSC
jgi:hypothetical protein